MRSNLIDTLLRFAESQRPAEEDPITEILAWLLASESTIRDCFCRLLAATASRQSGRSFELVSPRIATQKRVPRADGGSSRYDLVLESKASRAVVEIKIAHDLTPSSGPRGPLGDGRHQVHDYLDIADAEPPRSMVFTLAPGHLDVGAPARTHRCYGGHLTWQEVYDAFRRCLHGARAEHIDAGVRLIAEQFLGVMEARAMATTGLNLEGALAVRRWSRFQRALGHALELAWNRLYADGTLEGFTKASAKDWQEADQWHRVGYRLWAHPNDYDHFGFIGMWYGDGTIVEEVPDLVFFLHSHPRGPSGAALDARAEEIAALVATLDANGAGVRWTHEPGTWQPVWCRKSLAAIVLEPDPSAAVTELFREAVTRARESGLLDLYFDAVKLVRP